MEKHSKTSESFITGVIAIVFLIVGYQTAMFVYRASVMKIISNRDHPDTVYIYQQVEPAVPAAPQSGQTAVKVKRQSSAHSPVAEAVRRASACRKVESFSFNPNTATVEELCRLGFSQKQAQSIENYRAKGGRFNRKEDFAKSFVVSDSIFRRLQPYIDIPDRS